MEKKKAIIICSSVIAGVVLCLSVLFALRSISDYIQAKKENEENIALTQTYCDAISGDYNNWILSDTELQEIEAALSHAQAELSEGKVPTETRLQMEALYQSIDQYVAHSLAALDESEETLLTMELDAYLPVFNIEADLSVQNEQKIQTISADVQTIDSSQIPSDRAAKIEFFFRNEIPEDWTAYQTARETGDYREAQTLIQKLISDGFTPRLYEDDFENEYAYDIYLDYGQVPPVSLAEAYALAATISAERGYGDIDWTTYGYDENESTLEWLWHYNMEYLIDIERNDVVTREMYVAQLEENVNNILDNLDLIKEQEAEEARRRAAAARQQQAAQQQAADAANTQQPVQQEQTYVQETPVEDQIDYSAREEWAAARDAAHSSMDGGKAGGTESYFGARLTMN